MRILLLIAAMAALTSAARGAEPQLGLPLDCKPGETCWVVNYVDHDPGGEFRDYRCGALGYDGHDGTDFALRDEAAMAKGVAVLAAAAGVVQAVRDGMPDAGLRDGPDAVAGRECGNGVVVAHDDGWETQYCHMRRDSIAMRVGERVERGTRLGLVGLSGNTEFPHLHLTVRRAGSTVDPFLGGEAFGACRASTAALWDAATGRALAYQPIAIYNAGFSGAQPDVAAIRRGEHGRRAARNAPALVLWTEIFGVEPGDEVSLRITGPDGTAVIENTRTIERRQIRYFEFAGRRTPADAWPAGRYAGEIVVARKNGDVTVRRTEAINLR